MNNPKTDGKLRTSRDRETLRSYLDTAINYWRSEERKNVSTDHSTMCGHYIEAFQSARKSMLGATLPPFDSSSRAPKEETS